MSPELDAIVAEIRSLERLAANLDGVQPITVMVGSETLLVDPTIATEAYPEAAQAIRSSVGRILADLRQAIAATVLATSA